ncbi:HAD family hydrolase [Deinococcus cellulosilyticus]|uniref:Haloacid dehalogenase n=1 Tax=Deinococcus cellulosilyticus (strain DSM 18568 / NBRC 106333 / KACC 11606 / 5516J-15) TaxID=1223518 RepID=A0A511MY58_DEIC1|nr:HAD family hydrolase [Deinococcus cellulosilyticus]GEM45493.1 haloacid dehalogenase [Deinococcus cellulosilyticus NBRC 106333 = KACC 11606]
MLKPKIDPTKIRAVAFDVYGTLVDIQNDTEMFDVLRAVFGEHGRNLTFEDRDAMMRQPLELRDLPDFLGVQVPTEAIGRLEQQLATEVASIAPFKDATETLSRLRKAGYRVALCSNLSLSYAPPILELFDGLADVFIWSFEVGAVKPEPEIYRKLCEKLGCEAHEVLMVGDSLKSDHAGPRKAGLHGFHLLRSGEPVVPETFRSLTEVADWLTGPQVQQPLQGQRPD